MSGSPLPAASPSGTAAPGRAVLIQTEKLRKVYPLPRARGRKRPAGGTSEGEGAPPARVVALEALDLGVHEGECFGLLGPNGAGKTTTLGILTTRIHPTSGTAVVAGAEVTRDPVGVRRRIGVVPQRPNPDRSLTLRENLIFHALYFGISRGEAEARADRLLERLGLAARAGAKVGETSGGQQQRLMIARALMHDPPILFLDEPTVGLDPQARLALWEVLRDLRAHGRTLILTTHYMEEADRLCDRVAIIDRGKLLALDAPSRLKERAPGGTLVELILDGEEEGLAASARALEGVSGAESLDATLRVTTSRGGEILPALIRLAEESGRSVRDIHLLRPSLETLFISLTGRKLE